MPFNNRRTGGRRFLFFPLLFIIMILLLGVIVMGLWNAILPSLFAIKKLDYFQAVGLLVLCRILVGNFGRNFPGARGMPRGGPWKEKWMKMSPEERTKFREAWKERCRQQKGKS